MDTNNKPYRYPVPPKQFLKRVRTFALGLAVIQLFHLAIFTEANDEVFLVWLVVHVVIQASLLVLRVAARQSKWFVNIPWRPLVTLLLISVVFKLTSRVPYISSWATEGLQAREQVLTGGSASYVNIIFYPLAILLAFTVMPRRPYLISMCTLMLVCAVDFIFIGTRNAPVFVLLFHFLTKPSVFKLTVKHFAVVILIVVGFTSIFSYSTIYRSIESPEKFDWLRVFELTGSTQILKMNQAVVSPLSEHAPALLPAIFLSHYVTHSIAELDNIVKLRETLNLGGMYYITDQFCVIGVCSRADSLWAIESANPRPNVYQTIFSSLFFDFGIVGTVLVWIISLLLLFIRQSIQPNQLSMSVAFMSVMIAIGPVESYFFNGLGLVQILTIFLALFVIRCFARLREVLNKSRISVFDMHRSKEVHAHPIY